MVKSTIEKSTADSETFACDVISAAAALDVSLKALTILLEELRPPESIDIEDDEYSVDDLNKELETAKSHLEELQKKRFN